MSEPPKKPGQDAICPQCRQPGRPVSAVTVEAMVTPATRERLASLARFCFCATPVCDVAYHPWSNRGAGEMVAWLPTTP